jgi:predicted AlkP superfamily phosphohydrolase/phosphomutase
MPLDGCRLPPGTRGQHPRRFSSRVFPVRALILLALVFAIPSRADAYIGPGAGFALLNSFFVVFATLLVAIASLVAWPFRMAWRMLRRRKRRLPAARRLIIVGLDGQDPKMTERLMKAGKLPNFTRLAESGCYHTLRTTYPSVSPVAWSSFSTGTQPGRHNIFDFLDRDRRTYLPMLSSTRIGGVDRVLRLGQFQIPLSRPSIQLLRKSRPFWAILGDHDIWSTILRVPITFPPDRFWGAELSAMCVPDLTGTQGTFTHFTTRPTVAAFEEGGVRISVRREGDCVRTVLRGPENPFRTDGQVMELPLTLTGRGERTGARLEIDGAAVDLQTGRLSDWVTLKFKAAPGLTVSGICRVLLIEWGEHISFYVSPINLDPDKPAMPISHPSYYATYLAKKIGKYSTLGLAEDTWALNEQVIDESAFLQQTYDIDAERQQMFFAALDNLRAGCLVCVFDATDRIQHMFWRYLEPDHPALRATAADRPADDHANAIEKLYQHNDALVGRVLARLRDDDVIMVVSDHGFSSFQRGVNLNAWLLENGYLTLKADASGEAEWLREVDWSRTKAYSLGLTGIFLNLKGREASGIVEPGAEARALKSEIIARLGGIVDAARGQVGIREVFDTEKLYVGPYSSNAPDLLIGYNAGYRVSWACARGIVAGPVFQDNTKAWSGDHCIDPRLVPGVLFCNRRIDHDDPALTDIAPTALELFGIDPPGYMDGKSLFSAPAATVPADAA